MNLFKVKYCCARENVTMNLARVSARLGLLPVSISWSFERHKFLSYRAGGFRMRRDMNRLAFTATRE